MRVLVIGAGIGGLTLAHGLRQAGIDVRVYERRDGRRPELAGYGIHLNALSLLALERCLPERNWQRLLADSAPASDAVTFYDQQLGPLLRRGGDPATRRRGVDRVALQALLLDGLTDIVHFGKKFVDYEAGHDGLVCALFEDGTSAEGEVLVAADGANSRVREVRLPGLERQDLGVLTIAGRFPLSGEPPLPAAFTDGSVNNVVPDGPGWMFAAAWRMPGADYVTWAYAGARADFPDDVEHMSGQALQQLVLHRVAGWSSVLRLLVRDCQVDTLTAMPLKSMPQLEPWESDAVTLIGDAVHNMTPMAGIGANTALRDAYGLKRALSAAAAGRIRLKAAISLYESEMRAYANPAVALSVRNARTAGSDARLARVAFRTALRVAEALPPVKRAMFRASR
jgi:2-polyprenyl-6-methoxyphenol hydroxylase-like FAD-dependent oxidoreductase